MGDNDYYGSVDCDPAIGADGSICANAYQDEGKYIASVTTTPITTGTTGTTGTAVKWPDNDQDWIYAYAGTKWGKDFYGQPSG